MAGVGAGIGAGIGGNSPGLGLSLSTAIRLNGSVATFYVTRVGQRETLAMQLTDLRLRGSDISGLVSDKISPNLVANAAPGQVQFNGTPVLSLDTGVFVEEGVAYVLAYFISDKDAGTSVYLSYNANAPFAGAPLPLRKGWNYVLLTGQANNTHPVIMQKGGTGSIVVDSGFLMKAEWSVDLASAPGGVAAADEIAWTIAASAKNTDVVVTSYPEATSIFVATTGNDETGTGAIGAPFKTVERALEVASPGDTVFLRKGVHGTFAVDVSGTLGNPITIRSYWGDGARSAHVRGGLTGFTEDGIRIWGQDFINIFDLEISNIGRAPVNIRGVGGEQHGNIVIRGNKVHTCGDAGMFISGDIFENPIPTTETSNYRLTDIVIEQNDVSNTNIVTSFNDGGDNECITVGNSVQDITIQDNDVHDSRQYGIDLKSGVLRGIVRRNRVWNMVDYGIYLDAGERRVQNCLVYDNLVWGCRMGIVMAMEIDGNTNVHELSGNRIFNNLLWDILQIALYNQVHPKHATAIADGRPGLFFDNIWGFNTVYNADRAGGFSDGRLDYFGATATASGGNRFIGNLFHSDAPITVVNNWPVDAAHIVDGNFNFATGTPIDPLLADPDVAVVIPDGHLPTITLPDFSLQSGSPASNLVTLTGAADAPFDVDFYGDARTLPANAGVDATDVSIVQSLAIDEWTYDNYPVVAEADLASAVIPLTGTYTGTAPTEIQAQILNASNDAEVQAYATVSGLTASGGTWSGNLTMSTPGNIAYKIRARIGAAGATDIQTSTFRTGGCVALYGQSNTLLFAETGSSVAARSDIFVSQRGDASGGFVRTYANPTAGDGLITMLNGLAAATGISWFGFVGGQGSQRIKFLDDTITTGLDNNTDILDRLRADLSDLNRLPHMLFYHQGEGDAIPVSVGAAFSTYKDPFDEIVATIAGDFGELASALPVAITSLGNGDDALYDADGWATVDDWHYQLVSGTANYHFGGSWRDGARLDNSHYYASSYVRRALRNLRVALWLAGQDTEPARFQIASAIRIDATTTDVTLSHGEGTDFSIVEVIPLQEASGANTTVAKGFEITDDGTTYVPATGARVNATTIRLTHASIATTGCSLRHLYGNSPDLGGIVRDNSPEANPLEHTALTDITVSDVVSGTPPELTGFSFDTSTSPDTVNTVTVTGTWTTIKWQIDSTVSYASPAAMDATTGSAIASGTFSSVPASINTVGNGTYYLHMYASNAAGVQTGAPVSQEVTIDNTASTLTLPTASPSGSNISWGVTSNEAGGTIYAAARDSASAQLSAANIINGTGDAIATGTDATPTADANNGGLLSTTPGTRIVDIVHVDASGNPSNIVSSDPVTVAGYSQNIVHSNDVAQMNISNASLTATQATGTLSFWVVDLDLAGNNFRNYVSGPIRFQRTGGGAGYRVRITDSAGTQVADLTFSAGTVSTTSGSPTHFQVNVDQSVPSVTIYKDGVDITGSFTGTPSAGTGLLQVADYQAPQSSTDLEFADIVIKHGPVISNASLWNAGTPPNVGTKAGGAAIDTPDVVIGGDMVAADWDSGTLVEGTALTSTTGWTDV